jgi:hypothetical protein
LLNPYFTSWDRRLLSIYCCLPGPWQQAEKNKSGVKPDLLIANLPLKIKPDPEPVEGAEDQDQEHQTVPGFEIKEQGCQQDYRQGDGGGQGIGGSADIFPLAKSLLEAVPVKGGKPGEHPIGHHQVFAKNYGLAAFFTAQFRFCQANHSLPESILPPVFQVKPGKSCTFH